MSTSQIKNNNIVTQDENVIKKQLDTDPCDESEEISENSILEHIAPMA